MSDQEWEADDNSDDDEPYTKPTNSKTVVAVKKPIEDDDDVSETGTAASDADDDIDIDDDIDLDDMDDMNAEYKFDEDDDVPSKKRSNVDDDVTNEYMYANADSDMDDADEADGDDEDGANGETYLRKFDESTRDSIVTEFHNELLQHNYEEIDAMTHIVRTPDGLIDDPLHRTIPILTKYEQARVIGERAKQLNNGAKAFITVSETTIDGYIIAMAELRERKLPFIIKRPMVNGGCEYWKLNDLEVL